MCTWLGDVAGKVKVLAFANFGTAMRTTGADASKAKARAGGRDAVLDYSKQELSLSADARDKVCLQCCSDIYIYIYIILYII